MKKVTFFKRENKNKKIKEMLYKKDKNTIFFWSKKNCGWKKSVHPTLASIERTSSTLTIKEIPVTEAALMMM